MQGKDKVDFAPHLDNGDVVVVKNAQHVVFTGKKWKDKLYRHHTGYAATLSCWTICLNPKCTISIRFCETSGIYCQARQTKNIAYYVQHAWPLGYLT